MVISCDEETKEIIIDSSQPQGDFTASSTGTFTGLNDTGTKGTATLGTDEKGTRFLKFGSDFETAVGTGTVTIYLTPSMVTSKDDFDALADPGKGNPSLKLIGPVSQNGEAYYKISPNVSASLTNVLLWCGSANIPFGNAELN